MSPVAGTARARSHPRREHGFHCPHLLAGGGFRALPSGEDVDLVKRFEAAGYSIHRDTYLSVITSARTQGRATRGFAQYLADLGRSATGDCARQPA